MTDQQLAQQSRRITCLLNSTKAERKALMKGRVITQRPPTPVEADQVYDVCWKKILLLDSIVQQGIRHDRLEEVEECCIERHIQTVANGLLKGFPGHGQRSGEAYYMNWLGGVMVEIYVAKVILPDLLPDAGVVRFIGTDDPTAPAVFRQAHRPDLAICLPNGRECRFEIQYGADSKNMDVKKDKILEARSTRQRFGIETALLFLDPVRGIAACVRDIGRLRDAAFQHRAMLDNKMVWPIPRNYFVWRLDQAPPPFDIWPIAKELA